jgi:hypothetical protein
MANTEGFLDFVRKTAVGPVADNYLIALLDRHLFRYLQQQTTFGLVGDNAAPGSCPWCRESAKMGHDVGLLPVILPEFESYWEG